MQFFRKRRKKKNTEVYTTDNLDVAAYLSMCGFEPCIDRHGPVLSFFSFPSDAAPHAVKYLNGNVKANIHTFMYARYALKSRTRRIVQRLEAVDYSKVPVHPATSLRVGESYWYVDNGIVAHSLYGKQDIHAARLREGNAYKNRLQAVAKLNTLMGTVTEAIT